MKLFRLISIVHTFAAWRIPDLMPSKGLFNPLKVLYVLSPFGRREAKNMRPGQRLRRALEELGPIFIKFGQTLSTRPDLIPVKIAQALEKLQDDVEPFTWHDAKRIIEQQLDGPVDAFFASITEQALASASIAQVHEAKLKDGQDVVVKVIRPSIEKKINRDIVLMHALARFARKYLNPGVQVDPVEVVAEFEKTIIDELDLQREAANASLLRKNFKDSNDLYIPKIYWDYTKEHIMVQERIYGISIKDREAIEAAGINMQRLSEKGIEIFYTQVFRDNFFHADMHPGNIFINPENPENPQIILLDFGICGSLPKGHRVDLANNLMAFFKQDYKRVAELHIESGWVPADTNVEDLESATRTICEPYFARPIEEISFGEVMLKTFQMAKRFRLIIQPELILLQKTLLNIEGLGRQLYPQLDIWQTSEPILRNIMKDHYGAQGAIEKIKQNLPKWLEQASEVPALMHQYLSLQTQPLPRHVRLEEEQKNRIKRREKQRGHLAVLTSGMVLSTALLYVFDEKYMLWNTAPASSLFTGLISAILFVKVLKRL